MCSGHHLNKIPWSYVSEISANIIDSSSLRFDSSVISECLLHKLHVHESPDWIILKTPVRVEQQFHSTGRGERRKQLRERITMTEEKIKKVTWARRQSAGSHKGRCAISSLLFYFVPLVLFVHFFKQLSNNNVPVLSSLKNFLEHFTFTHFISHLSMKISFFKNTNIPKRVQIRMNVSLYI